MESAKTFMIVDLPPPLGPTTITPNLTLRVSKSWMILSLSFCMFWRPELFTEETI